MESGERQQPAILIIEADIRLAGDWARYFSSRGFTATRCASLRDAKRQLPVHHWQAVVMDILLPDGVSLELLPILSRTCPRPLVLVASAQADAERALVLAKAGVPLIPKPVGGAQLLEYVVSSFVIRQDRLEEFFRHHGLDGRQQDVIRSWLQGRERKETADDLGISTSSVGTHWSRICEKTGFQSQHDVIRHLTRVALGLDKLDEQQDALTLTG